MEDIQHYLCVCVYVCQTTVVSVRQTLDYASTGQWEVETESRDGQRETRVFDAVMVCTGHFTQPHLPLKDFPGTRDIFVTFSLASQKNKTLSCNRSPDQIQVLEHN